MAEGMVRNNSDERGAKLVAGSSQWKDYTVSADLKFDGEYGDMGVIIRSTEEEEGVDAYNGYYVGLRTTDGTLIIGRSDYGWMEARPMPMPGGIHADTWYRLRVTAVGCQIAALAQNLSSMQTAAIAMEDPQCPLAGRIGLRSLATGGAWRDIEVRPAELSDYQEIRNRASFVGQPEFPKREADYNRIFRFSSPSNPVPQYASPATAPARQLVHAADLQSLQPGQDEPVTFRGVVTLTTQGLYVQDSESGVQVSNVRTPSLNVGDAVEVEGRAQPGLYSAKLSNGKVRLLWSGTPMPPVAITALQAASGDYDARFVEIEARLTAVRQVAHDEQELELVDNDQPFRALYVSQSSGSVPRFEVNSRLRIRGVCVLDRQLTRELTPFVMLLRSNDDIQLVSGPPWWTPWHLTVLFVGLIGLALLAQLVYFRIHEWQTRSVTQERERLALEVHDTMAQSFAGVGFQIQGIQRGELRKSQPDLRKIGEQLDVAYQLVRRSHEEASRTIAMLNVLSPELQGDLLGSLAETARKIAGDEIETITTLEGTPFRLNLRIANALSHIGQEAIVNAVSHGNPTVLRIVIRYRPDWVELGIKDNGSGFDCSPEMAGFGIQGMQKRARDIGGVLEISSLPGHGTELWVRAKASLPTIRGRVLMRLRELRYRFGRRNSAS